MLFTSLSGDSQSASSQPLAYVLQIDDIKILLDCGSPEWCPESDEDRTWQRYTTALKE
jgi:cleavage and polyadenylation specificity factor subunit 2